MLLQFGREINVESAVHAKVVPLREGLLVMVASSHLLVFKSNYKSIVVLVADPLSAPWRFYTVLCEYCHVFGVEIRWSFFSY